MNQSVENLINIDGTEFNIADLSAEARAQINNIKFVEVQLQQLNSEWAVADTARMAYTSALKRELSGSEQAK